MRGILWWERLYNYTWNNINSLVNYTNVEFIHVFWLGRIIVAVPCQDIIDTSKPVVLAGHCDYCVQCTIYIRHILVYTIIDLIDFRISIRHCRWKLLILRCLPLG